MMMTQQEEQQVSRRGVRITVVVLALVALALYLGPFIKKLWFD
jgi:hypothetical protein